MTLPLQPQRMLSSQKQHPLLGWLGWDRGPPSCNDRVMGFYCALLLGRICAGDRGAKALEISITLGVFPAEAGREVMGALSVTLQTSLNV